MQTQLTPFELEICGSRESDDLPPDVCDQLKTLRGGKVFAMNDRSVFVGGKTYHLEWWKRKMPFCVVNHRRGGTNKSYEFASSVFSTSTTNYLLCCSADFVAHNNNHGFRVDEQEQRRDYTEYKYHVDPDTLPKYNKMHYVNVNRTSEQIGGSSWAGNLVSWHRAGFRTRILYGIAAGLFPEE